MILDRVAPACALMVFLGCVSTSGCGSDPATVGVEIEALSVCDYKCQGAGGCTSFPCYLTGVACQGSSYPTSWGGTCTLTTGPYEEAQRAELAPTALRVDTNSVYFTVANTGGSAAAGFRVSVKNAATGQTHAPAASYSLGAGQSAELGPFPRSAIGVATCSSGASSSLRVSVDTGSTISELDETDNTRSFSLRCPDASGTHRHYPLLATASSSNQASTPDRAIDGSNATSWNAGTGAPSYLMLDLGRAIDLARVKLVTMQAPAGATVHELWGGPSASALRKLAVLSAVTADNVTLDVPLAAVAESIRYLQIRTTTSPSWVAWREVQVYADGLTIPCKDITPTPFDHFGYYASSFLWLSPLGEADAIRDHADIDWVGGDGIRTAAHLAHVKSLGMKAIAVPPYDTFFTSGATLQSDYPARWNTYASAIAPYVADGTVAAIYPYDEPYYKAMTRGVSFAAMKASLDTVIATVKGSFPTTRTAVVFSPSEVNNAAFVIPTGYDWVGFDCYSASFLDCYGHSGKYYLGKLEAKMSAAQKAFLVPLGAVEKQTTAPPTATEDAAMGEVFDGYVQLAVEDPKVIAMFPFLWQYYPEPPNYFFGTSLLTIVKEKAKRVGQCAP